MGIYEMANWYYTALICVVLTIMSITTPVVTDTNETTSSSGESTTTAITTEHQVNQSVSTIISTTVDSNTIEGHNTTEPYVESNTLEHTADETSESIQESTTPIGSTPAASILNTTTANTTIPKTTKSTTILNTTTSTTTIPNTTRPTTTIPNTTRPTTTRSTTTILSTTRPTTTRSTTTKPTTTQNRRTFDDTLCARFCAIGGAKEYSDYLCRLDVKVRCPRFNNGVFSHWAKSVTKCDKMPEVHKCCFSILQNGTSAITGVACSDACEKLDIDLRERSRCIREGHLASVGPTTVYKVCDDGRKGKQCDPFKFLHQRCCEIVVEDGEANVLCTRRCQKLITEK